MAGVRRLICLICIAPLAVACSSGPTSTTAASPTPAHGALLVFTKWVADANVRNGVEPGYKPELTGLTGHDVSRASAQADATGVSWIVSVTFTPGGRELFRKLTHDSVNACGQDCPQRHLTIWLDLTQSDIDSWGDPAHAAKVSQPYDLGCLSQATATVVCPKLLANPTTLQEITGGKSQIAVGLTEQGATELAGSINTAAHA